MKIGNPRRMPPFPETEQSLRRPVWGTAGPPWRWWSARKAEWRGFTTIGHAKPDFLVVSKLCCFTAHWYLLRIPNQIEKSEDFLPQFTSIFLLMKSVFYSQNILIYKLHENRIRIIDMIWVWFDALLCSRLVKSMGGLKNPGRLSNGSVGTKTEKFWRNLWDRIAHRIKRLVLSIRNLANILLPLQ